MAAAVIARLALESAARARRLPGVSPASGWRKMLIVEALATACTASRLPFVVAAYPAAAFSKHRRQRGRWPDGILLLCPRRSLGATFQRSRWRKPYFDAARVSQIA